MLVLPLLLLLSYLVGSVPTGYWFSKYFFGVDITQNGSGNIGATNVARVLGKRYFLLIFLCDALKAYGMLALCSNFTIDVYPYALVLLLGNAYSIFLSFKGGKGVATAVGIVAFFLPWQLLLLFIASWFVALILTKTPFVASICSIILVTGCEYVFFRAHHTAFLVLLSLWIFVRHWSNIRAWYKTTRS